MGVAQHGLAGKLHGFPNRLIGDATVPVVGDRLPGDGRRELIQNIAREDPCRPKVRRGFGLAFIFRRHEF